MWGGGGIMFFFTWCLLGWYLQLNAVEIENKNKKKKKSYVYYKTKKNH